MSKKAGKSNGSFGDFKFVNVRLDKADQEWMGAANLADEFPLTGVISLATEGYKFSLSEDAANHSYVASLTDRRAGSPTEKHILTGRGSTPIDAWFSLCYKHLVKCQEDWGPFATDSGGDNQQWG